MSENNIETFPVPDGIDERHLLRRNVEQAQELMKQLVTTLQNVQKSSEHSLAKKDSLHAFFESFQHTLEGARELVEAGDADVSTDTFRSANETLSKHMEAARNSMKIPQEAFEVLELFNTSEETDS
jgi:chromosome segregation ATPase